MFCKTTFPIKRTGGKSRRDGTLLTVDFNLRKMSGKLSTKSRMVRHLAASNVSSHA
jgi:hypothetical protein